MGKYSISSGVIVAPEKVVIYGPEGIGKTTFASKFPDPVFIDTEGGSGKLDVKRLPSPNSWAMLIDEVEAVRRGEIPCGTIVIDTADWAERLCVRAVCAAKKWDSIEAPGYGKGYTYAKEEFGKLLDILEEVKNGGRNVVITAHAQITKFEQPDEMGQYDRWSMKTSKQIAPLLREWCDMLLFANYKTFVVKDGEGKGAKGKAQGGQRVMYTTHHPCWDAKNRDGLPEECAFDYSSIAAAIPSGNDVVERKLYKTEAVIIPSASVPEQTTDSSAKAAAPAPAREDQARYDGIPGDLLALMEANKITESMVRQAVFQRGCYPEDMSIGQYDKGLLGNLVAKWPQWLEFINKYCDGPF